MQDHAPGISGYAPPIYDTAHDGFHTPARRFLFGVSVVKDRDIHIHADPAVVSDRCKLRLHANLLPDFYSTLLDLFFQNPDGRSSPGIAGGGFQAMGSG